MQFKFKNKTMAIDTPTLLFHGFFILFYLFFMVLAFAMPWPPILFPMVLTITGLILSVVVVCNEMVVTTEKGAKSVGVEKLGPAAKSKKYPIKFMLFLPLFPLFNYFFGMLAAVVIFNSFTMRFLEVKWKFIAFSTLVFILCMYGLFHIFQVDIPAGLLFDRLR